MPKRKGFTTEYKKEIIRQATGVDKKASEIAKNIRITGSSVRGWID